MNAPLSERPDFTIATAAEECLLGSLLMEPRIGAEIDEVVRAEDFALPAHRTIFRVLRATPDGLDAAEAQDRLRQSGELDGVGGMARLGEIMETVPSAWNAARYAKAVREAARRRALVQFAVEARNAAVEQPGDAATITEMLGAKLCRLTDSAPSAEPQLLSELFPDVFDSLGREQQATGGVTGVDTGFAALNALTGGWQLGALVLVAARPSVGKSTFGLTLGLHAADRARVVLLVTAEMSARELARNALCHLGRISSSVIRTGGMTKFEWERLGDAANRAEKLKLLLDDTPSPSPTAIRNRARRVKTKHGGLDLVIVDYLQLLRAQEGDNREQQVASISRALKAMARELNVPVIALAQLNRAQATRKDHRPQLSDLRESGSLEQDADVVVLLHPKNDSPAARAEPRRIVEVNVAKNRNGACQTVDLLLVASEFRFEEPGAS